MSLPEMSSLQFLVVGRLFAGRHTGRPPRNDHASGGENHPHFALQVDVPLGKVELHPQNIPQSDAAEMPIRECLYEVTDLGLAIRKQTPAFYADAPLPPAELTPLATDEGPLADQPRIVRQNILRRRIRKQLKTSQPLPHRPQVIAPECLRTKSTIGVGSTSECGWCPTPCLTMTVIDPPNSL